ncbi:MAG: hypothetical protein WBC78_24520 [Candidatus Sulfotelmatobacter sp.]
MVRCRVSFTDSKGVVHTVGVEASSVYEAVALAVVEFRSDTLSEAPGALTEFTISIARPTVERRIRLGQVTKWTEGTRDGPAGLVKRQRAKELLGKRG